MNYRKYVREDDGGRKESPQKDGKKDRRRCVRKREGLHCKELRGCNDSKSVEVMQSGRIMAKHIRMPF